MAAANDNPSKNRWGAVIRSLGWTIAVVVGFRDVNVTLLLIPIWAVSGYEITGRIRNGKVWLPEAIAVFIAVTLVCAFSYGLGKVAAWLFPLTGQAT